MSRSILRQTRPSFAGTALWISLIALIAGSSSVWASTETRIADLVQRLEEKRVAQHIPGMALVVVQDGEVLLAKGFGVTNIETKTPVSAETLFMIGSTTKAFTATLVGMQVDAGKMAWDEPIATYLPYFDPKVDSSDANAKVTVRDTLSHRSGFARMTVLLTAQDMSPRELLEVANNAEPFDEFRKGFYYNNIMVLAAGTAAASTAESDWATLVRKRIFKPLGMKRSFASAKLVKGTLDPGYSWSEELATYNPQPILSIDVAGPAGSIVSNAQDMGTWLNFLLAKGEHRGKRLIEAATLEETWVGNIAVGGGVDYGMGWMIRDWQGRKEVDHGGNINGFTTQVGLIPEEKLGFALMMNLNGAPLQNEVPGIVWETMLGEPRAKPADGVAAEDHAAYLGEYVANFAAFQDTTFAVTDKNGVLFVDVPGQTNYELKAPNEDGRRPFALTDTISVSFEADEDGAVNMMRMHQGGLDFEIPRRGVEPSVEIDPAELAPYLGVYRSAALGNDIVVRISNHRLALDVPNQLAFELHQPDAQGRRKFRIRDIMSVRFDSAEDGAIASMTLFKGDEQIEVAPRIGEPDEVPLPTLDEIVALRSKPERLSAYKESFPIRIQARQRYLNAGLIGNLVVWSDGKRDRTDLDNGKFGWVKIALGEKSGEVQTHVTPLDEVEGRDFRAARQNRLMTVQMPDWREAFERVLVLKREELDGKRVVVVRAENPDTPAMTFYVDAVNGDVLRYDSATPIPGTTAAFPFTATFEDYRDVDGLRIPFRMLAETPQEGRSVLEIERFETGVAVCDALFRLDGKGTCPEP